MSTNKIGLLVSVDDLLSQNIVQKILQRCIHKGNVKDALKAIWAVKDDINLCLTNVQRLEEMGSRLLDQIHSTFDLPIILMTPDSNLIEWKGEETKAAAYVLNDLSIQDIAKIWEHELAAENEKNQEETAQIEPTTQNENDEEVRANATSFDEERYANDAMGKGKEVMEGSEQGDDQIIEKKHRLVWTKEMHHKFLEAIELLGPDRAFPKKITEIMNIPGLTRENVASHLQKYRLHLRREEEEYERLRYGTVGADNVGGSVPTQAHLLADSNYRSPNQIMSPESHTSYLTMLQFPGSDAPLQSQPSLNNPTSNSPPGGFNSADNFIGPTLSSDGRSVVFTQPRIPGNQRGSYQDQLRNPYPSDPVSSHLRPPFTTSIGASVVQNLVRYPPVQEHPLYGPSMPGAGASSRDALQQFSPGTTTVPQNPSRALDNIPQPQTSVPPSGRRRKNAPAEGPNVPREQQAPLQESSTLDDVEFRVILREIAKPGRPLFLGDEERSDDEDPNLGGPAN